MLFRLLLALAVAPAALRAQMPLAAAAGGSISDKVAWLAKNAVALRSIDPHDGDFADLQPLKKSIGDARIVLLGEPRTKDAAAVKAKQRLVRFFHEEMGFDVLASGVSLFDGEEMDKALDGGRRARVSSGLTPGGRGGSVGNPPPAEVFDYARATRKTGRPLHVAGLGFQVSLFLQREYAKRLFQFIDRVDPRLAPSEDRKAIKTMLDWFSSSGWMVPSPKERPRWQPAIANLYDNLGRLPAETTNAREIAFFRRALENLAVWAYTDGGRFDLASPQRFGQVTQVSNLIWLAKEWRTGSKIIVWSDNFSIRRNWRAVVILEQQRAYRSLLQSTLGTGVDQEFGAAAYAIAFAAVGSDNEIHEILRAGPEPSLEPAVENIEGLLHATGKPYLFLDFRSLPRDHWLRAPIAARLLGDSAEVSTWPLNFDAVFCIDLRPRKAKK